MSKVAVNGNGVKNRVSDLLPDVKAVDIVEVKTDKKIKERTLVITPPKFEEVAVLVRGTSPYCQNRFSHKALTMMKQKQEAGSTAAKTKTRTPKDFQQNYEDAKYLSQENWIGIPATAFKAAMISACRLVSFKMTIGKLSLRVMEDGYDKFDFKPLVKITKGEPRYHEAPMRNHTGVMDIRARPLWEPGWECVVRIRYDSEQFRTEEVLNLLRRVGAQVGVGEGRPDSRECVGLDWGLFDVIGLVNSEG